MKILVMLFIFINFISITFFLDNQATSAPLDKRFSIKIKVCYFTCHLLE